MSAIWVISDSKEVEGSFSNLLGIPFSLYGPKRFAMLSVLRFPIDSFPWPSWTWPLRGGREWMRGMRHRVPVNLLRAPRLGTAVEAMRLGAADVCR